MNITSFILLIFGLVMLLVAFCFFLYERNRRQFDGKVSGTIVGSCYDSNAFNHDGGAQIHGRRYTQTGCGTGFRYDFMLSCLQVRVKRQNLPAGGLYYDE